MIGGEHCSGHGLELTALSISMISLNKRYWPLHDQCQTLLLESGVQLIATYVQLMTQKVHTYVATSVAIHIHTYIRTYTLSYLAYTYVLTSHSTTYIHACIRKCICMYIRTYVYTDVDSPYGQIGKQHSGHVYNFDFMCHPAKLGARGFNVSPLPNQEPGALMCHPAELGAQGFHVSPAKLGAQGFNVSPWQTRSPGL